MIYADISMDQPVERRNSDDKTAGLVGERRVITLPGRVVHRLVPLSPSSIICYWCNKWSKNFDERPHRHVVIRRGGE